MTLQPAPETPGQQAERARLVQRVATDAYREHALAARAGMPQQASPEIVAGLRRIIGPSLARALRRIDDAARADAA